MDLSKMNWVRTSSTSFQGQKMIARYQTSTSIPEGDRYYVPPVGTHHDKNRKKMTEKQKERLVHKRLSWMYVESRKAQKAGHKIRWEEGGDYLRLEVYDDP